MTHTYFRDSHLRQLNKKTPAYSLIQPKTQHHGAIYLGMAPVQRDPQKTLAVADLRMLHRNNLLDDARREAEFDKIKASKPYLLSNFAGAFHHRVNAHYQDLVKQQQKPLESEETSPLSNTSTIVVSFLTDKEYEYHYHDGSSPAAKRSSNFYQLPLKDKTCRFRQKNKKHLAFAEALMESVIKIHEGQKTQQKPIYFHCNVGVGRSLMGCAAYLAYASLEKDINEKQAHIITDDMLRRAVRDAFLTIKKARPQVKFPRKGGLHNTRVNFVVNCFRHHSKLGKRFDWTASKGSPSLRRR